MGNPIKSLTNFCRDQAEIEGKDPGAIMDEMLEQMDQDAQDAYNDEMRRLSNEDVVCGIVRELAPKHEYAAFWSNYDVRAKLPAPVLLLGILEVTPRSQSSTEPRFRARFLCEDGLDRVVRYHAYCDPATQMEPEDSGEYLTWEPALLDYETEEDPEEEVA